MMEAALLDDLLIDENPNRLHDKKHASVRHSTAFDGTF